MVQIALTMAHGRFACSRSGTAVAGVGLQWLSVGHHSPSKWRPMLASRRVVCKGSKNILPLEGPSCPWQVGCLAHFAGSCAKALMVYGICRLDCSALHTPTANTHAAPPGIQNPSPHCLPTTSTSTGRHTHTQVAHTQVGSIPFLYTHASACNPRALVQCGLGHSGSLVSPESTQPIHL